MVIAARHSGVCDNADEVRLGSDAESVEHYGN
jgi:hypothetical protein